MIIRDAKQGDIAAIANLHAESWRQAYRGVLSDGYLDKSIYQERLATWERRFSGQPPKSMFVMVADVDGQLMGFICVFPDENRIWGSFLDNLHVSPHLTGQGIGRQLLSEAARRLLAIGSRTGLYLWVIEQNHRARQFYQRAGAVEVGSAENLMPDGKCVLAVRCFWAKPTILILENVVRMNRE